MPLSCSGRTERGRKVVLSCLLCLVVCHLGLLILWRRNPESDRLEPDFLYQLKLLRARQAEAAGRPEVLGLGTSRMAIDFLPSAVPALSTASGQTPLLFNFGRIGSAPADHALTLKVLRDYRLAPDYLVLDVFPPFLQTDFRMPPIPRELFYLASRRYFLNRQLRGPWAAVRRLYPLVMPQTLSLDPWGACPLGTLPRDAVEKATGRILDFYRGQIAGPLQVNEGSNQWLHQMLDACREQLTPVILVEFPESTAFRALYSPEFRRGADAYIQGLCREYGLECVDARGWAADEDYVDGIHLHEAAARRFTQRLGQEVIQPLLEGRSRVAARTARAESPTAP